MASLEIRGLNDTIMKIREFGIKTERMIELETEAIAVQIEADAKAKAPKNFGKLAQSISREKVKNLTWKVTVNEKYGAYMEFGTGTKVNVPAEFKEIAMQFKGSGRGPQLKGNSFEDGLQAIEAWCLSKGISILLAKWIFLKILGAGVNPQPFLYPSWIKGKKDYVKNLEKILSKMNKKI